MEEMSVLVVAPDRASNSLGRAYVHWEMCRHLGWIPAVVAANEAPLWAPVRGTAFGEAVTSARRFLASGGRPDIVVCVKPLTPSLELGEELAGRFSVPLVVDIDDPDLSATLALDSPIRRLVKTVVRPDVMTEARARRSRAEAHHVLVSNPVLQRHHGGVVVPHARPSRPPGQSHTRTDPVVAFIGTNRPHKGVEELRRAIARVRRSIDYTLVVTDDPPPGALPWERWVGQTSVEAGTALLDAADVVVLPSRRTPFATGQLPAKLIDSMISGRAIAVSDVEPLPWALHGAGEVVRAGSVRDLVTVLERFAVPEARSRAGAAARDAALSSFTYDAVGPAYRAAVLAAVRQPPS